MKTNFLSFAVITAIALSGISCQGNKTVQTDVEAAPAPTETPSVHYVDVVNGDSLNIYTPDFSRIDLVTNIMPSKEDEEVILCFEAAFTGQLLNEFSHSNIAGHHVSSGEFFQGYKCGPNNGVFTWSPKSGYKFYNYGHKNSEAVLKKAAEEGGMGFCQSLLMLDGVLFKGCFKPASVNQYRALCELDGKLCVVDCAKPLAFGNFLNALKDLGVKNAIYCDMGTGWNFSWYRNDAQKAVDIFSIPGPYTTNWVTFYAK